MKNSDKRQERHRRPIRFLQINKSRKNSYPDDKDTIQLKVYRRSFKAIALGPAARRIVALKVVLRVAEAFRSGAAPMTPSLLSDQIQMPERLVNEVAEGLESAGIVRVVEEDQDAGGALVMARDPASVQLLDVVEAVDGLPPDLGDRESDGVASILQTLRLAQANSPENLDIGALLERDSASEA